MKKIGAIVIVLLVILALSSYAVGDTSTVTGQFNPSTTLSAELWNSSVDWGSVAASGTSTKTTMVNNTGDVNADITIKYATEADNLELVTSSPGQDQYMAQYTDSNGDWLNITSGYTSVVSNLTATTGKQGLDFLMTMGSSFSEDWGTQWFNITVQYVAHT